MSSKGSGKTKGSSGRGSSHKASAQRGMSSSGGSGGRNFQPRPRSSDHSHQNSAQQPRRPTREHYTGADHPHFYTHGRSGGGQGMGLRHDSFASAAPNRPTLSQMSPGSQNLSQHLAHSLAENRAAQMADYDDAPGADMHKATMDHYYGAKNDHVYPENSTRTPSINDMYAPPYSRTDSFHARMKKEVDADYYGDLDRKQMQSGIKFPEMPTLRPDGKQSATTHNFNQRLYDQSDLSYLKNQSYQDKIRDNAFDEFDSPLDAGFRQDFEQPKTQPPSFKKKVGSFFNGDWFGGGKDGNNNDDDEKFSGKDYHFRNRQDNPYGDDEEDEHAFGFKMPDMNDPTSKANFRPTSQSYRPKTDSTENVIDWQMVEHEKPDWKEDPYGTGKKERDWRQIQKNEEMAKNLAARNLAIARTMHYNDPRLIQPRGMHFPNPSSSVWKSYLEQQRRRKMNEDPFAWNGNHNNRIWGRQTWVRLLKNMRPRHPPIPDGRSPLIEPPELTKEDELFRQLRRNERQDKAVYIAGLTDVAYNTLKAHNFYEDKINTLRGNADQLSEMQNQVNQLKAQFYGRGQGVATHPAARNKREPLNAGKYDTLSMAVDRQIERDYNEARRDSKNVSRVDDGDVSTLSISNATPTTTTTRNDLIMGPTKDDLSLLDLTMRDAKARNATPTTKAQKDAHNPTAAQTGIKHAALVEQRHAKAKAEANDHSTRHRKTKMVMRNGEQVEVSDSDDEEDDETQANQSLQQDQTQSTKSQSTKSKSKSKSSATAKKLASKSTKSKRPVATNTTTPTLELEDLALESVSARQFTQGRDVIVPKTVKKVLKKSPKLNKLVTQHRYPVSTQQAVAVLVETRQEMDKMLHALEDEMDGDIDDGEMEVIQSKLGHLQTLIEQTMRDTHHQLLRAQHMHRYEIESENIRQEMWQRQAALQREQRQQQEFEEQQQRAAATSLLNRSRNRSAGNDDDDDDDDNELNLGQFLHPQPVQFRQQQPELDQDIDNGNHLENDADHLQNRVLFHHYDPNQLAGGEDELEVDVIPLFNNPLMPGMDMGVVDMGVVNPALVAQHQAEVANNDPLAMPDNTVAREVLQQQQHHRNLLRQQQAPSPSLGGMSGVIAGGLRFGGVLAPSPSVNPLHSTPRRQFSTYGGNESPLGAPVGPPRPGQSSANHNHIDLGGQSRHQFPQSPSITSLKSQELAQQRKTKEAMTPTMGAANKKIADMVNNTNNNETGFMNSFSLDSDIYTSQDVLQLIKREERQYEQDQRMSSSRAAKMDVINSMKRGSSIPRNQNGDNTTLNFSFAVPKPIPQDKPSSSTTFTQPLQPPQVIQMPGGNLKHAPQFQQQLMSGLGKTPTKNVSMTQAQSSQQQQQQSKPKQAALPGTPVSIGKRRYSTRANGSGVMEPVEFDSNSNSIATLSLDHDLMTTSTTIPVNSIMGVSPTQSPVEIDHQLAMEQSQIMANHPAVQQQQQQQPIVTSASRITDRGVSLAQIDARNSDTNLLEQQHQVSDRDGYKIPGIDVNLINSVRFTHQPGRANQLSVTNDVVPRSGDSML